MGEARRRLLRMLGHQNGQPQPGGANLTPPAAIAELTVRVPAGALPTLREAHARTLAVRRQVAAQGKLKPGDTPESLTWERWLDKLLEAGFQQAVAELAEYEKALDQRRIISPEEYRRGEP